jgi:hypothetical protein
MKENSVRRFDPLCPIRIQFLNVSATPTGSVFLNVKYGGIYGNHCFKGLNVVATPYVGPFKQENNIVNLTVNCNHTPLE